MRRLLSLAAIAGFFSGVAQADPTFWKQEWPDTNFEITSLASWSEIRSGGVPKDGITALHDPGIIRTSEESRLAGEEPVVTVQVGGTERAYPIRYLIWHEIVTDKFAGIPFAVTYCPLCNSAIVFDRRTERGVLTFGVTGKLRNSDMIMYDHETESWWQQATGEAVVGDLTGLKLKQLTSWMESWDQYKARNPNGIVINQPTFPKRYGANPYPGYDSSDRPFLYSGENPPHGIPPLVRVVRVGDRAWPMTRLQEEGDLREAGVAISWDSGQVSALDARRIADGRDVGTVRVRNASGQDIPHDVMFAFAFHAFWPDGQWMLGQ